MELLIQNGANVNLANTLVQSTLITSDHSSPFTDLTTACQLQQNDGGTPLMVAVAVVQECLFGGFEAIGQRPGYQYQRQRQRKGYCFLESEVEEGPY